VTADGYEVSFRGEENVLELVRIEARICKYTRDH